MSIVCKSRDELASMREAGKIVAGALDLLKSQVRPGVTTGALNRAADAYIRKHGGVPTFKGYKGFPASICVSINEAVVHGIPGKRKLAEGEIVSIDVGVTYRGYVADAAMTQSVGEIDCQARQLLETTQAALAAGIEQARVGNRLGDVSHAIQRVAEEAGFSVVREYVGHGIGAQMHEDPAIPNFGSPGKGPELLSGMALALEPMVNAGTWQTEQLNDGWTVVTKDRRLSAHFEHTVAVTDNGPWILTVA